MMNKKYLAIVIMLLCINILQAQPADFKAVAATQAPTLLEKIAQNTKTIQSLQADFIQEKKLTYLTEMQISKGIMYYKSANQLRWEYLTPKAFSFILNNNKIIMKDAKGSMQYNANSNKSVKAMSELILGMINGNNIQNSTNFNTTLYSNGKQTLVKLIPVQKELKKMFQEVLLYLNQDYIASKIELTETSGDKTTINFSSVKKNITVSETLFK
ncbi:MAG: outer membrane lipoprotein carrier protein LolA [Bacteroidales bacterium]|jgi:outer membrane lipoprotein carrier protein|nr:outer membrane lipoprotein carrier protein LolA [Bacteroidales bacterium]